MDHQQSILREHARVLRRYAWLIALVTAITLGVAAAITSTQSSVYRASMKIVVGQGGGLVQPQFGSTVDPFTTTMANLLKSNVVATRVIANLGLKQTPPGLLSHLGVSTKPNSSVLEVHYDAGSGVAAQDVLHEVGVVFKGLVRERLQTTNSATKPITAAVFDDAHSQAARISPRPVRNLVIAGGLGIGLGIIFAFAFSSVDTRLRSRQDAEEAFGAPVLGALPKGFRGEKAVVADGTARTDRLLNALDLLRAKLEFSTALSGTVMLITSAHPEEGKSTVTANLGLALALAGKDVVCVEADLRRPRLLHYLDIPLGGSGLMDVVEGRVDLDAALYDVPLQPIARRHHSSSVLQRQLITDGAGQGRLRVLASGVVHAEPTEVFTSDRFSGVIDALRLQTSYVLFDAPPILLVGDAFPLVRAVDGVIVVARGNRTSRDAAEAVGKTLRALEAPGWGVILTDSNEADASSYGYGYGAAHGAPTSVVSPQSSSRRASAGSTRRRP